MRSPTRIKSEITLERAAELERLRYQVKRCEDKGLFATSHHEMLVRLESELGLIPAGKNEGTKDEVTNG